MNNRVSSEVRRRLAHVVWLGGSPCSGKSSIAGIIGQKYGLTVYHYDRQEPDHIARAGERVARFPALASFLSMNMDERWVLRSPGVMSEQTIATWTERFPLVVEDLLALPDDALVLAEGPGLFPNLVGPLT